MLHVRAHILIPVGAFQLDKSAAADELRSFWVNCKGLCDNVEREKWFLLIFPSRGTVERNVCSLGKFTGLFS